MNKEVSLRQIAYLFLFISLSPILRQIPNALADEAGRSGYLSPLWSVAALIPLTAIVIAIIKLLPGLNIYEIMELLTGKFIAKVLILGYLLWIMIAIASKVNIYSFTVQFTLMPQTKSSFFMVILIVMVYYALYRGLKTVFRFSEFVLGPVIVLFGILLICALTKIRTDYLLPVSTIRVPSTILASKNVIAVGGNIIIALFFADKYGISVSNKQFRKLWMGILAFVALSFIVTIFTFGITGADITSILPFPFYITVKSISLFNILERFEVLITLICVLSDFISICILSILLLRCIEWLFHLKQSLYLYIPLTAVMYYLTFYICSTQFEFNYLYRNIIVYLNIIFQYIIPFFLGLLCLLKQKKIKKL